MYGCVLFFSVDLIVLNSSVVDDWVLVALQYI